MSKAVFITGGSSGIGLAVATEIARSGLADRFALFARDPERLRDAAEAVRLVSPDSIVSIFPVDLLDALPAVTVMDQAVAELGLPQRLILSAGMTCPGRWDRVDPGTHRRVMDLNYFGSFSVVHHLVPKMAPGSSIAFIGSAAGLVATYGYAAYSPSKFALHGLAETLRVELRPRGISVTLCMPPDTDTPMLAAERPLRPAVTSRLAAGAPTLSARTVARATVNGMEAGRFLVLPGFKLKLLYLFGPWIAPILRWHQASLIRRFGQD